MDKFNNTVKLVYIIISIHEYFANLTEVEYTKERFMDNIGYDTLIEIGIPTQKDIEQFMEERTPYIPELNKTFKNISERIIDGIYNAKLLVNRDQEKKNRNTDPNNDKDNNKQKRHTDIDKEKKKKKMTTTMILRHLGIEK
jgi:hypothetical protein